MKHDAAVHGLISKQYSVFNHEGMGSFVACSFTSAEIICEFKSFKQVHFLVLYTKSMIKFNEFRENKLKEDVGKTSFQELADSSGHLIVKRSPINVAKTQKKGNTKRHR